MKLKGIYNAGTAYDVGDVVKYSDNHVYHLHDPAPAGTDCHNTLYWQRIDQLLEEAVLMILDATVDMATTVAGLETNMAAVQEVVFDNKTLVLASSTADSDKVYAITVDDEDGLQADEIVEEEEGTPAM